MKYLNLTRDETKEFLKNQSYYQLTKQPIKTTNKPIVVSYPNERWSADLIDINQYASSNSNNKFILTVIDNFSKYVFAVPLKNKEAQTITDGFEKIVNEQAEKTYPSSIQTDNGTEFAGEFIDWCKANRIFMKKSLSYSPTSNSLIENFNNILRKMIREGFVRTNSFNWIKYLDQYLTNRNNTPHSLTKHPPSVIWKPSRERIVGDEIVDEVKQTIKSNAKMKMKLNQVENFYSGEMVRVLLSSLFPKIRKLIKSNLQKLLPVKYSPNVYNIEKIKKPIGEKKDFMKPRYTLSYQGKLMNTDDGKTQLFYGSELQRVDKISTDEILTQKDAMKLNLLKNEVLFDENDQLDEQAVDKIKNPLHYEKKIVPDFENPTKPEPEIVSLRKSTRTIKPRNILDL
jgi:transposase InsO family protein